MIDDDYLKFKLLNLFFDDDHAKERMFCKHSTVSFMPSLLLNKSLKKYHIYTIFKNLVGINLVCHKSQRWFFFTSGNHGNEKLWWIISSFFPDDPPILEPIYAIPKHARANDTESFSMPGTLGDPGPQKSHQEIIIFGNRDGGSPKYIS